MVAAKPLFLFYLDLILVLQLFPPRELKSMSFY